MSRALLIDFDGPLCRVFSACKNTDVAAALRDVLADLGVAQPDHVLDERDPLEILRWAATLDDPVVLRAVEDGLRAAEVRAVRTAAPAVERHRRCL